MPVSLSSRPTLALFRTRFPALQAFAAPAAWALLLTILIGALAIGHDGIRTAQMLVLALPALVWLGWPMQRNAWSTGRTVIVSLTLAAFILDAAFRSYLRDHYRAAADSSLVMSAVANTNPRESWEYLAAQWPSLATWGAVVLLALGATGALVHRVAGQGGDLRRWTRWTLIALLALGAVGHVSKPWRRLHPMLFWPTWSAKVDALRHHWADQQSQRDQLLASAKAAHPTVTVDGPSTVVLVLSESLNRDNMSLYGYARDTTPELLALRRELGPRMLQVRHAWSVESATLPSLSGIFSFGERCESSPIGQGQHLLALARAAGYKVWWISNHDDVAIEQQHGRLADHLQLINREPGRSSATLDGQLLGGLDTALRSPEPRKLIVLHLLGAHPHYRLRFPADQHPFDQADDKVERSMEAAGRPLWLREMRQSYDAAVRYHDGVVAQTLRRTRASAGDRAYAAWMMLSDHGQEVGHTVDEAGHSPGTAAGYRIPLLIWQQGKASAATFDDAMAQRPFRADWAGWTMAHLLRLRSPGQQPTRDVLDPAYVWTAPQIPVAGWQANQ